MEITLGSERKNASGPNSGGGSGRSNGSSTLGGGRSNGGLTLGGGV